MKALRVVLGLMLASLAVPAHGAARRAEPNEEPLVRLRLEPYAIPRDPEAAPAPGERYKRLLEIQNISRFRVEIVADRRLLEFTLRSERPRRTHRCVHPQAPRGVRKDRIRVLEPGEVYQEWIDLRMVCWGAGLRALDRGGPLEVRYGFARPAASRWVVRASGGVGAEHRIRGESAELPPAPPSQGASTLPVVPELAPASAPDVTDLRFRVRLRPTQGRATVYLRPDLFRFQVEGPGGTRECGMERAAIHPIVELYQTISFRNPARMELEAAAFCPDAFSIPGVYDVRPLVDLVYGGEAFGIEAVTGSYEGASVPVRILGSAAEYVEQPPAQASVDAAEAEDTDAPEK